MDLARKLLLVPCHTKEHLKDWLKVYLDFHIFDVVTSRFATATPLDAAWDAYKFAVYPEERKPRWYLFASARSTQKTITLAATEVAIALHTKRNILHYAGSKDQSEAGYTYVKQFLNKPRIRDLIKGEITASQTELYIPDMDNPDWLAGKTSQELFDANPESVRLTKIKIMSISPFQTQGAHESVVGVDEIHTLKGEKRAAYKDIRKIPVASWDGKPWIRVGISSRKSPTSVVEEEIENKDKSGLIIKQWTVFEGIEQCPTDRNGGDFIHERMVNIYDGSVRTIEDFDAYSGKDKDKYTKTTFASGCLTCPLHTVCLADLSKPKVYNKHHQSIEAAITDFISDTDRDWYIAQCLSLQPSREGIVFSRFDRHTFEKTPTELYEIFTGKHPGKELEEEELINFMISKGVKRYAGLDHGFTDPMAIVVAYEDSIGTIYIMKTVAITGLDPNQVVAEVKRMVDKYKITHLYPDTAQPMINELIRKAKIILVCDDFDKKDGIADGITLIKSKISPNGMDKTLLYGIKGNCESLTVEMEKYHYMTDTSGKPIDEPEDEYNHATDAMRYMALNRWKTGNKILGAKDLPKNAETHQDYIDKVNSQHSNWLNTVIKEQAGDNHVVVNKSKNGGIKWDI